MTFSRNFENSDFNVSEKPVNSSIHFQTKFSWRIFCSRRFLEKKTHFENEPLLLPHDWLRPQQPLLVEDCMAVEHLWLQPFLGIFKISKSPCSMNYIQKAKKPMYIENCPNIPIPFNIDTPWICSCVKDR